MFFYPYSEETRYPRNYIYMDNLVINGFSTNFFLPVPTLNAMTLDVSHQASITGTVFHKSIKFQKRKLWCQSQLQNGKLP